MSRPFAALVFLLPLALLAARDAHAQGCEVKVGRGIHFGEYDPLASGFLDTHGELRFRCEVESVSADALPAPLAVKILESGRGRRAMAKGGEEIVYELYLDAGRSSPWGSGGNGTSFLRMRPGGGGWQSVPIYARVPLGQDVSAGSYHDTIVVTVEW